MFEPVFSPLGFAIQVERARHEVVTLLDGALWRLDATLASTRALHVIAETRGLIHAGEVGRAMGVSRQAAAVLVRRHVEAGHLTVVDEGWAKSVRITGAGREHLAACVRVIDGALGRLRHIPDLDLIELEDTLHHVSLALGGRHRSSWVPDA